ncbi:hypothetical protein MKW98_000979 [Papaver atlanticum]|uniref:Uncharacterized protein n=1 Tax=Papaver atlanticum TaxID=357466 RepID=A0AAD4XCI5_9MAGN|nr:hypothetical protein MKW98_000979 [Papaver atlanticum]
MASHFSIFAYNVVSLVSILLASASADDTNVTAFIVPSVERRALTTPYVCDPNVNVYTYHFFGATKDCNECFYYCTGTCEGLRTPLGGTTMCTIQPGYTRCDCCCKKPRISSATPTCPPPTPRPPPPPCSPPTPSSDQCTNGDDVTEITMPCSNCDDCTNWCKEDCSESGGRVIENKCAIGESKLVRRCKCCCRGGKSGPKFS